MQEEKLFAVLQRIRRHLHSYPELSFQEEKTRAFIAEELAGLRLTVERVGGGLTASLRKGRGKTVALRADMDALPLEDAKKVSYASKHKGICHACGHDAHMAMVLGAAHLLQDQEFQGEVRFLFQPGEELPPGGALPMVQKGALNGVDAIFGLHLSPFVPFGLIGLKKGAVMAAADRFKITVTGKSGHGAIPHKSVDAIVAASQAVAALQTVASRWTDPLDPMVLTIGRIQGGTAFNIIAGEVQMEGTVRTLSAALRTTVPLLMERALKGVALSHGASISLEYSSGYPALVNPPEPADLVAKAATAQKVLWMEQPLMGSEDFSYYLEEVPGCYFFLGTAGEEEAVSLHNCYFDFDERVLPLGASLLAKIARDYLETD
jgi:amidohydrolase